MKENITLNASQYAQYKTIPYISFKCPQLKDIEKEVTMLETARHHNIVIYHGHCNLKGSPGDLDSTGMVMELCHGTLKSLVKERQLNLFEVAYLIQQLLTGVDYLHAQGIIHR